jgi:hypothetical protein
MPGGYDGRQDSRNRRSQEGSDGSRDRCAHTGVEAGAAADLPRIIKGRPFWSRFGVLGSTFPERNTLYDEY